MKQAMARALLGAVLFVSFLANVGGEGVGRLKPRPHPRPKPGLAAEAAAPAASNPACARYDNQPLRWQADAIQDILRPRAVVNGVPGFAVDTDQVMAQAWMVGDLIDDCVAPEDHRFDHLRDFAHSERALILDLDHQFGHGNWDDDGFDLTYLQRVKPIVTLPPLLTSQRFLHAVSGRHPDFQAAWNMVLEHNRSQPVPERRWTPLIYRSQLLRTPDPAKTAGRFFVLVPGEAFDQWIQFGIHVPDDDYGDLDVGAAALAKATPSNNVSVVAIYKRGASAAPVPSVAIVDWWRTLPKVETASIELGLRREVKGMSSNCFDCHKTGAIGIHPAAVYTFDKHGALVSNKPAGNPTYDCRNPPKAGSTLAPADVPAFLNRRLVCDLYAAPHLETKAASVPGQPARAPDDTLSLTPRYGPSLGSRATHDPALMAACAPTLTPEARRRVELNMTCAMCHHEERHGLMNFPLGARSTHDPALKLDLGLMQDNPAYWYVLQGLMPPKDGRSDAPELDMQERQALFACLQREYHDPATGTGLLDDWLRNEAPRGVDEFRNLCAGCHQHAATAWQGLALPSLQPGSLMMLSESRPGPDLTTVLGRPAASLNGFPYSAGMRTLKGKVTWDDERLREYLADPPAFVYKYNGHLPVPIDMPVHVDDPAVRQAIAAYLKPSPP